MLLDINFMFNIFNKYHENLCSKRSKEKWSLIIVMAICFIFRLALQISLTFYSHDPASFNLRSSLILIVDIIYCKEGSYLCMQYSLPTNYLHYQAWDLHQEGTESSTLGCWPWFTALFSTLFIGCSWPPGPCILPKWLN